MEEEELQIMFKKKKNIETPKSTLEYDHPLGRSFKPIAPAVTLTPEWYKQTQRWATIPEGEKDFGMNPWPGLKHCMPFLDALSLGYYILLDQDVYVIRDENGVTIDWEKGAMHPVEYRPPHVTNPLVGPAGYGSEYMHYHWFMHVSIRPPEGYSMIITHPFNRYELPFFTLTGVVDDYAMPGANASFFLKNDFEGVIPKGTPIAQVIPFRREDWKSVNNPGMWEESRDSSNHPNQDELLEGFYRKSIWKKKSYK
jgi:hypothetical protein